MASGTLGIADLQSCALKQNAAVQKMFLHSPWSENFGTQCSQQFCYLNRFDDRLVLQRGCIMALLADMPCAVASQPFPHSKGKAHNTVRYFSSAAGA